MSCDAALSAAFLWLAAAQGAPSAPMSPEPPAHAGAVAHEPLFADIIQRAGALKTDVEAFRAGTRKPDADFASRIRALAALDMQAHATLVQRGTDGDLKCILKGIAQDLQLKLEAVNAAATPRDRDMALGDMAYLLNDNVEVIAAPPAPPV